MRLPFTHQQFLDVFGAFNTAWWPAGLALWLLSALAVVALARGRVPPRLLFALLALHWAWSGAAYHLGYFATINPVARVFGALFLVQAALFLWVGVSRQPPPFTWGRAPRQWLSVALAVYALAYPLLVLANGLRWPRMPVSGVPCPTTLFTIGLLLALEPRRHRELAAIPILWALVGGSAAVVLGMVPDLALFAGAICLVTYVTLPRLLDGRAA